YGARFVQTTEYATIHSEVPNLKAITPQKYEQERSSDQREDRLYDSVWSFSSLEHDDLGCYSDPLNPNGDMQTMTKLPCMLKPVGILVLTMPALTSGRISFNVHCVYGPI
ncbi:unnamed protein product, partial [Didymodactylos carnosus]